MFIFVLFWIAVDRIPSLGVLSVPPAVKVAVHHLADSPPVYSRLSDLSTEHGSGRCVLGLE